MRRGFTLIELVAVMGIVVALAALLFPVLIRAVDGAEQGRCASNLHQIYLQTEMYAADYDPSSVGDTFEMGLPPFPEATFIPTLNILRCARSPSPSTPFIGPNYWIYFVSPDIDGVKPSWRDYTTHYGDASIMYADPFHNDPSVSLESGNHVTKHLIGVTIGGSAVHRDAKGDWMIRTWWNE